MISDYSLDDRQRYVNNRVRTANNALFTRICKAILSGALPIPEVYGEQLERVLVEIRTLRATEQLERESELKLMLKEASDMVCELEEARNLEPWQYREEDGLPVPLDVQIWKW